MPGVTAPSPFLRLQWWHMEPDDQEGDEDAMDPALLERRAWAAGVDAASFTLCGFGMFLSFSPLGGSRGPLVWAPSAAGLALLALVECFTGVTLGKWMSGLAVRRPDGARPPIWAFILRGCVRLLPVAIFLLGLAIADEMASGLACIVAVITALCYFVVAYLLVMR